MHFVKNLVSKLFLVIQTHRRQTILVVIAAVISWGLTIPLVINVTQTRDNRGSGTGVGLLGLHLGSSAPAGKHLTTSNCDCGKASGKSNPTTPASQKASQPTNSTVAKTSAPKTTATASVGAKASPSSPPSASCSISAILVNSCRPWLGAAVNNYPGVSGFAASIANHEGRLGRQLDIVHDYRTPGQVLSTDDVTLAKRANTILLLNWKPTTDWASGGGGNSTVNSQIDAMANSIKSLGSTKIMLAVFHEPENDVSPGGDANCPGVSYKGSDGTVSDYVNMWHNVRARFDALGVGNVVWVMDYMGYPAWNCLVPDLWPGNTYVDWVMWDPYTTTSDFNGLVSTFYSYLSSNSNSANDYLSKPWGLAEWGNNATSVSQSTVYSLYDNAKAALDNNTFPKLKAYVIFDENPGPDIRLDYSSSGAYDPTEQSHYNAFANDSHFSN